MREDMNVIQATLLLKYQRVWRMLLAKNLHETWKKNMRMKDRLTQQMKVIQTKICFTSVEHSKVSPCTHRSRWKKGWWGKQQIRWLEAHRRSIHPENMKKHANERESARRDDDHSKKKPHFRNAEWAFEGQFTYRHRTRWSKAKKRLASSEKVIPSKHEKEQAGRWEREGASVMDIPKHQTTEDAVH